MNALLRALLLGVGLVASPFVQAATAVLLDSEPGDYIGQGQRLVYGSGISYSASTSMLHVAAGSYDLYFELPRGSSFAQPGTYDGATRYPFNSPTQPGLSIDGDGRGCNRLGGSFEVIESQFSGSGQLLRLAVDFVQHCEFAAAALYGAVRINSDIPLDQAGPHASVGRRQFVYGGEVVGLDGSGSYSRPSSVLQYQWTQDEGTPVTLQGGASALVTFTAPYVAPGGETLKFELQVTDSSGRRDTEPLEVRVLSKSDPQTAIYFVSDAGDWVGAGRTFRLLPSDGDITIGANFRGGASLSFYGDTWYNLDFGPAEGVPFQVGAYDGAQRFSFADADRPGIDINGDGRGCNTVTGRFDVRQLVRNAAGATLRFFVDFEQHCEGGVAALRGKAMYNYLPDGIPTADAGADSVANVGSVVSLDGRASTDDKGITRYRWRQLSGPAVNLNGADTALASFVMPDMADGTGVEFQLLVVDDDELTAADTVKVAKVVSGAGGGGDSGEGPSDEPSGGGGGGAMNLLASMLMLGLVGLRQRRKRPS